MRKDDDITFKIWDDLDEELEEETPQVYYYYRPYGLDDPPNEGMIRSYRVNWNQASSTYNRLNNEVTSSI